MMKRAATNFYGVTSLDPGMLSSTVPRCTYGGGPLLDPAETLTIWRTVATEKAKGTLMGFYLSDDRLEPLFARPHYYALGFVRDGVLSLIEPDFSLWADDPVATQIFNTRRKRSVGRQWQEFGLRLIPDLNWADERSFSFCFAGIPVGCPVAFTECRTASSSIEDRKAFLLGLHEAIRQVQPQTLVIYGGVPNRWWIERDLPQGETQFIFLESWADARGKIRKAEKRQSREKGQLNLFQGGSNSWVEEEVQAA